ncbi:MAG: ParB/RepB/Spo0J family partition protein [Saccharofermentanales bacterium]|jgi:ParB family chromosome partitioning protein
MSQSKNRSNQSKAENKKTTGRGLGRGLNALLGTETLSVTTGTGVEQVKKVKLNDLSPNQDQPRQTFDPERLQELADSIQKNGIVQPLLVIPARTGGGYTIVAGERRWRAARLAGLKEVPVIVRALDDKEVQRIALIENINREDLNQIEEAQALQRLLTEHAMTQEELAVDIGRSRSAIANTLRLLNLPEAIQDQVRTGSISAGHARALLALKTETEQVALSERIINEGLSVRETERAVQRALRPKTKNIEPNEAQRLSIKTTELSISKALGTKVRFTYKGGRGSILIRYKNLDELQRLLELFGADGIS